MKKIFILMFCMILLVGSVSAVEWDNVASYDEETKTVTIVNALGFGADIATVQLKSDLIQKVPIGYGEVARFEIKQLVNYNNPLKELELFDKKNGNDKFLRDFDFKVLSYETVLVEDYGQDFLNGEYKVFGTHEERREVWKKLNAASFKKNDNLTIAIFTEVQEGDYVEWIPNVMGIRIDEWAVWTADLNVDINHYYKLNDTTDSILTTNLTNSGGVTFTPGLIGLNANGGVINNGSHLSTLTDWGIDGDVISMSVWVNATAAPTVDHGILGTQNDASDVSYILKYDDGGGTPELQWNRLRNGVADGQIVHVTTLPLNGSYQNIVVTYDGARSSIYFNGVLVSTDAFAGNGSASITTQSLIMENVQTGGRRFNGKIDEVGIWGRNLTQEEITQLYNGGVGITFTQIVAPTIILNSPVDFFNTTNNTLVFNGTVHDEVSVGNITLYIDGLFNETNSTPINNTPTIFTKFPSDGQHNWTYEACDDQNLCGNRTRTFSIDSVIPALIISFPNETITFHEINTNLFVNWSVNDTNPITCTLEFEGVNTTQTCIDNQTTINITNSFNRSLTFYVNDSFLNMNSTSVSWNYRLFQEKEVFTSSIIEGGSSVFSINLTTNGSTISIGNLSYNLTENIGTIASSGNSFEINRTIVAPAVNGNTNLSFFWNLTQIGGFSFSTANQNQTVNDLSIDACSINTQVLYNFTIVDEISQVKLINATQNTTGNLNLQIFSFGTTNLVQNFSNAYFANGFSVCLNDSLSSGEDYNIDVQVQYGADDYVSEFFHIQNDTLNNDDFPTNITLFDLDNITSQVFEMTFKDESFLAIADALVQIQRKYVSEGVFKTVEIPKTDTEGTTVGHLQLQDVIYTFIVVKNGVVLATFNDVLVDCNPLLTTCKLNLNSVLSHIEPEEFTTLDDFVFTLEFNESTRTITSIFSVPSSTVATVFLNATLLDALGTTSACSDSLTSSSGTLTCSIPTSLGNASVLVSLSKDNVRQGSGTIKLEQEPEDIFGANLIFLVLFLYLTLIGVGISDSPMVMGVFLIFGAILGITLNLIDSTGFIGKGSTILWFFIAVVLVLIKGAKRT